MSTVKHVAPPAVRSFREITKDDVAWAGGKGANLGELTRAGVPVPPGFVVGAPTYAAFCESAGLRERITDRLAAVNVDDTGALRAVAEDVRSMVEAAPMPSAIEGEIRDAYAALCDAITDDAVAVRSSATAEDTEAASFAGMNETFLNVKGADEVVDAVLRCWGSLFGARTIFYRAKRGFGQADMDIAVIVQAQIASVRSGVMFTIDPATGATDRLVIEGSFGLGEAVVSGQVSPDRYVVDKETRAVIAREVRRKSLVIEPTPEGGTLRREASAEEALRPALTDAEAQALADLGRRVEEHYGSPQDTEWAIDADGTVWMLQSRPVTAAGGPEPARDAPEEARVLMRGLGAAPGLAAGQVQIVRLLEEADALSDGAVLVTHMTAPDWVPLMRRACAIVTETGGMTCHAAIVSRELGIPCVVGTGTATTMLRNGELVTVDATRGLILEGAARSAAEPGPTISRKAVLAPVTGTSILLNLSEPSQVAHAAALDVDGVGLLRAEMMLLEALGGAHPRQLIEEGRGSEVTDRMAEGLTVFAAGFTPRPITYRTIDFRTNEFRGLRGGERFEPSEANPMIGYRGAFRYTREPDLLRLELDAIRRVWEEGHTNLHVMLPFVRTTRELAICRSLVEQAGLLALPGFALWVMAEVPSVLYNLADYAALGVAGISIGSNDLTQLVLGADRDSEILADVFDERDPAVVAYLQKLIPAARALNLKTSICGQAPSVHAEYAEILVEAGIDAISVNVDAVDRTRRLVAAAEQRLLLQSARGARPPRDAPAATPP